MNWKGKLTGILFGVLAAFTAVMPAHAEDADTKAYSYNADDTAGASWVKVSDTEWVMDIDGDGDTDVTLDSSLNSSGHQVFTYTFNVEDNDQTYYVYEQMLKTGTFATENVSSTTKEGTAEHQLASGYTSEGSDTVQNADGTTGHPQALNMDPGTVDSKTHTYTITNTKSYNQTVPITPGTLKITKRVSGDMIDPSQKFYFTVTLAAPSYAFQAVKDAIAGTQIFGDVVFTNGTGLVSLGKDESVEITGIPSSVKYTVTEAQADYYGTPTKTNDTGTITGNTTIESVWTNTSTYTPPVVTKTVSFHIAKKVTGAAAKDDTAYSMLVHLTGLVPYTEYSVTGDDAKTFKSDDTGIADVLINLKKDQSVTVNNIPEGATYQVNETGGDYVPSYQVTDAADKGKIVQKTGTGTEDASLSTAQETADDGEDVTITFTNSYTSVQKLTVRELTACRFFGKTIAYGTNEYNALTDDQQKFFDSSYEVTVDFSQIPAGTSIDSPIGLVTPNEDGEASKTFELAGDGSAVVFQNIPKGVQYKITETANDDTPSYAITTEDSDGNTVEGTVASKTGNGQKKTALSTAVETVEENQSDTVTFTNLKTPGVNFAVLKTDRIDTNSVLSGAVYSLISCTDGNTDPGEKTTGADGYALWDDVPSGTYVLKEVKAPKGYTLGGDYIIAVGYDGTVRGKQERNAESTAKNLTDDDIAKLPQISLVQVTKNGTTYDVYQISDTKIQGLPNTGGHLLWLTIAAFGFGVVFMVVNKVNRKGELG